MSKLQKNTIESESSMLPDILTSVLEAWIYPTGIIDAEGSLLAANDGYKELQTLAETQPGQTQNKETALLRSLPPTTNPDHKDNIVKGVQAVLDGRAAAYQTETELVSDSHRHGYRVDVRPLVFPDPLVMVTVGTINCFIR